MGRIKAGEHAYDDRVSREKVDSYFLLQSDLNVKRLVNYCCTKKRLWGRTITHAKSNRTARIRDRDGIIAWPRGPHPYE